MYYLHNVAIVVTAVWKHFEYNKYLNFVIIATENFVGRNLVVGNSVKPVEGQWVNCVSSPS